MISRRGMLFSSMLAASCNRAPAHQRVDPALGPLIPADTTALAGVRLDNLKKTPAWDKLFPAGGSQALEGLEKRTGMDLRNSLYEVVYCLGGKRSLALVRGKFVDGGTNNSGLEPNLKLEGAQKFPYKGFVLIGREEAAVTFLNSSVAAAGPAASLRTLIDARELKNAVPVGLMNMVETLPFESDVYVVSDRPSIPEGGIGGLKSLPLELKSVRVWFDFRTGAGLHADIETASDGDAKKMIDGIKGLSAIARLRLKPGDKKWIDLLDSMQFYQEAARVKGQAEIPLDLVLDGIKSIDAGSSRLV